MKTALFVIALAFCAYTAQAGDHDHPNVQLDVQLNSRLKQLGFTGQMQNQLEKRLRRRVDQKLANIGRLLWFDTIAGLNNDNSCAGCHSPTNGFGDTQSIAIGIQNNGIVGPDRMGPRNQRRTPMALNSAFFPNLMWNSRFSSNSGNPFDNSSGFTFPLPEGNSLSNQPHLLNAQAFIPPTERVEAAGFEFPGNSNDIRAEVMRRINDVGEYRKLFSKIYPTVKHGGSITYDMFAAAIAEFEFTLVFADAPIDRFARGDRDEMSDSMKRGALLFFGKANCVSCHAVSGKSNEMFSDFKMHVAGTPQVNPDVSNVVFDGEGRNEDFGLTQVTGNPADLYKFRSSPLRNVALQTSFFHNGAFVSLDSAIRYHLNPAANAANYTPALLAIDLQGPTGPMQPVLDRLDPAFQNPPTLSEREIKDLVDFVGKGLLDRRAQPREMRKLVPDRLPSGRPPLVFQFGH